MEYVAGHVKFTRGDSIGIPDYFSILTKRKTHLVDELMRDHVGDQVILIFEDSKKEFDA